MRHPFPTLVLGLSLGIATGTAAAEPLAVHVMGAPIKAPTKDAQAQLKQKSDAARTVYFDLVDSLKKQHGKKMEAWPQEAKDRYVAAHDAFFEAQADWFYSIGVKQKDIDDSVREVTDALLDKRVVQVASSPDAADLVVQVVGRAKVTNQDFGQNGVAAELVLRVGPGGRVDAPALARSGAAWSGKESFWSRADTQTIHTFTADAPYWLLISQKPGMGFMASYKAVAKQAADAIGKFGVDNADKVVASRRAGK